MKFDSITKLDEYLTGFGFVHLYINEYRITHSCLHVLLTGELFHDRQCDLYLSDCTCISGPPSGGPWRLRAAELQENGRKVIKLYEETERFFAKALQLHVVDKAEPVQQ